MTNLEIIKKIKASTFTDEDGESYELEFEDGLAQTEIDELSEKFPSQTIDPEIIEILKFTKGWDGYSLEHVYFNSIGEFGFWELSENCLTVGHDGFGNHWILDINEKGKLGKVFFACHDPAVFVIHSQNLNEYLHHLLELYENPGEGHLNEVHEKTVMTIWDNNKLCFSKAEFEANNPTFKEFLAEFKGENWIVADLRKGMNKDGFSWGKFGPNKHTKRHPTELVWVIGEKKKGFFQRFFG